MILLHKVHRNQLHLKCEGNSIKSVSLVNNSVQYKDLAPYPGYALFICNETPAGIRVADYYITSEVRRVCQIYSDNRLIKIVFITKNSKYLLEFI